MLCPCFAIVESHEQALVDSPPNHRAEHLAGKAQTDTVEEAHHPAMLWYQCQRRGQNGNVKGRGRDARPRLSSLFGISPYTCLPGGLAPLSAGTRWEMGCEWNPRWHALMTSNGCVARVAMAPAPAADAVCTTVEESKVESFATFALIDRA